MIGAFMGQMEHVMAEQIQENEFIDSLNHLMHQRFFTQMKSIHLFIERTTAIKSLKFIVKPLKMNAMKTLEHYLSIEILQKNMKSLK